MASQIMGNLILLKYLFTLIPKKTSKVDIIGLLRGESTDDFMEELTCPFKLQSEETS